MRLADGTLWPMPITLDVSEAFADGSNPARTSRCATRGRDPRHLTVTDKWTPDKAREAEKVFGADDIAHPAVYYLHNTAGPVYLGGPITGIQPPTHYDFRARRDTPNELRAYFRKLGWRKRRGLPDAQPAAPRAPGTDLPRRAEAQANLLIHPVVGMTKPGDVDHFTRVRCYEAVLDKYPAATTTMSLLNLAMRMAGPREAVWHGLIRKNHGCTHIIVGRDHAGPGKNSAGRGFLRPLRRAGPVPRAPGRDRHRDGRFKHMVYVQERAQYEPPTRSQGQRHDPQHLGHRAAPPPPRGAGDPRMVLLPRGGERAAPHLAAAREAGLHRVLHRPFRLGQVDHRQRADGQADGDGRPAR
jgi:sulfate adenylyltransferase